MTALKRIISWKIVSDIPLTPQEITSGRAWPGRGVGYAFNSDVRLGVSRRANAAICVQRIGTASANTTIKGACVSEVPFSMS